MTDIKFSIVKISLNSEEDIENTIVSVAGQTYINREHTIIDGGSQDSTADIIRKYNEHMSYWISEPDNGIADAFNKGIEQATGDYFDPAVEEALYDSRTMRSFMGIDLGREPAPDETTVCKFRH